MNTELGLCSIVRPKKPVYEHGKPHKIHDVRYNCTIIDLHERSVIASITDRYITIDLAIRTLRKALDSQPQINGELILHSDQGSQFTSKSLWNSVNRFI